MKYQKPELTELGVACEAIASTTVKGPGPIDTEDFPTNSAYEADE
jgi:hypothetical protein